VAETQTEAQVAEGRKGDGYLIVVQDNAARALTILGANEAAVARLGYPEEELKGRKLEVVLGARTALTIEEDLEYEDDAPDMADVLARHRELRLRSKKGDEITVPMTINRVMAEDKNPRFQIIIPNEREGRARAQWRDLLKQNFEGHTQIDEATGLPNRATAENYLRVAGHYLGEADTQAAFAVLRLDRYEKSLARYGQSGVIQQLQHVANICRATFRSEDVICTLGGPLMGLLLVDISRESAQMVFNRLRWNIRSHHIDFASKADFSVTVSIVFEMLTSDNSEQLLAENEKAIAALGADERNILLDHVAAS
jgi:diguanylate cyclase (GGDEF)-like protein